MKYSAILILAFGLFSCDDGKVKNTEVLDSGNLPESLKNLKVYTIPCVDGTQLKVGVLDGQPISYQYHEGKVIKNTIIVSKPFRQIEIETILMENDSVIVCRKTNH